MNGFGRNVRGVLGDLGDVRGSDSLHPITGRGPHEAFLVRPLLRGTIIGLLHQECSNSLREPLAPRERRKKVVEERHAARAFLNATSLLLRVALVIPVVLLFIPLTAADAWDSWTGDLVLALLALLLLGAMTAAVRLLLLQVATERRSRALEPWNGDLVWQTLVVTACWSALAFG